MWSERLSVLPELPPLIQTGLSVTVVPYFVPITPTFSDKSVQLTVQWIQITFLSLTFGDAQVSVPVKALVLLTETLEMSLEQKPTL